MKYSIFFAATAAAYDSYGGYAAQSSSAPSKPSSSPPSYGGSSVSVVTSVKSSAPASKATPCSTTVGSNGYTTVVPGYGKPPVTVTQQHQSYPTCAAKGQDGKSCDKWEDDYYVSTVVTDYNKKVVTVTNAKDYVTVYQEKKTITHSATPTIGGYGAISTGTAGSKNATGVWYELYEKVILCQYAQCGKNVLVGYTGSGICQKCNDEQPVTQKEYKGGKWTEEKKTMNYGKPKDEVKVYEKPGVYTVTAKVVTVYKSEATGSGKPSYEAGVYHIPAKVITITKSNEAYTCTYELPKQTPSKTPSKSEDKPVTKTPTVNDYGYKVSATPTLNKPSNDYPGQPIYPNPPKSNSTTVYKPSTTPTPPACYGDSCPCYGDNCKKTSSTPSAPSSTPSVCYGDNCPCYGDNCKKTSSTPSKPSSTPTPPACYGDNCPCYGDNCKKTSTTPSKPTSTPCDDDKKATSTPVHNGGYVVSTPPAKSTPTPPAYDNGGNYNEAPKSTPTPPVYNNGGAYGEAPKPTPTPTPVYNNGGAYGEAPKSTPTNANGASYGKRSAMMERRMAAIAQ